MDFDLFLREVSDKQLQLDRYNDLKAHIKTINNNFKNLRDEIITKPEFQSFKDCIELLIKKLEAKINTNFDIDSIVENYEKFRQSPELKELIIIKSKIDEIDTNIEWINETNYTYLNFETNKFDLSLFAATADDISKKYLHTFTKVLKIHLNKYYSIYKKNVYDIQKLKSNLSHSIEKIRDAPQLRGCSDAFNKILNSVDDIENNIDDYYDSFTSSGNNITMMACIINDINEKVENDGKTSPQKIKKLKIQFSRILGYYQRLINNMNSSGTIKNMQTSKLIKNFESMNSPDFENFIKNN